MTHKLFTVPFGATGDKTAVPNAEDPSGLVSYEKGFPADYERQLGVDPLAKRITRENFNSVLYDLTKFAQETQAGAGQPRFDADFATAIGGYDAFALIPGEPGEGFWISTDGANTDNPSDYEALTSKWRPAFGFFGGSSLSVAGADPETGQLLVPMLTAAYPSINVFGTLTHDVDLVFPSTPTQRWIIQNNTTGNFTVTASTVFNTGPVCEVGMPIDVYMSSDGQYIRASASGSVDAITYVPSGDDAVQTTVGAKIDELVYSAKSCGATGLGVEDDTANLQKVLNNLSAAGGGAMFVPEGVYMVMPIEDNYLWLTTSSNRKNYAALLIPSNCRIFGVGEKSVFKLIDTLPSLGTTDGRGDFATTHIMVNDGAIGLPKTIVNRNITVHDLKFDGNLVEQSGEGVSLCGVENFKVQSCDFTNSYYETNYFVFCRGGDFSKNHCHSNGIYQIDGGGPMVDSSENVLIHDNTITDSGYYSILMIDSFACSAKNNRIYAVDYATSAGYQAIRVAGCSLSEITSNSVSDSGYSAIWVHNGHSNTIDKNTIWHAGYAAGGGSNIHGITVDYVVGNKGGRHTVDGNKIFMSNGAGIAILEAITNGSTLQENAGTIVTNNTCLYNGRDGIAVFGKSHRIKGNTCESNGLSVVDGILGNGYNGISLNGAKFCSVTDNSCSDIIQIGNVNINMDAKNDTTVNPKRFVTHAARTQNYGIVEYPGDCREETPTLAPRSGVTVTVTSVDHTVETGRMIHTYGGAPNDYNGYFIPTKLNDDQFTFDMIGNPVTIASILTNGTKMIVTSDEHGLGIGEIWNLFIENGDGAGDWYATVLTSTTSRLENMPNEYGVAGSTLGNYCQLGGGDVPDDMFLFSPESMASTNNIIKNNVLVQNISNPTLGTGSGYHAYSKGASVGGVDSIVADNL